MFSVKRGDIVQCVADDPSVDILERFGVVLNTEDGIVTVLIDGFRWLLSIHEIRRCDERY